MQDARYAYVCKILKSPSNLGVASFTDGQEKLCQAERSKWKD